MTRHSENLSSMTHWPEIAAEITDATHSVFKIKQIDAISGGCINKAYCIADDNRRYFIKLNSTDNLPMFEAEAAGLNEIYHSQTLRVPTPICWGNNESHAWLVSEYLEMSHSSRCDATTLGTGLAAMHRFCADQYGWQRNNTIGDTPQINAQSSNWIQFWRTNRLGYQLQLAKNNGYTGKLQKLGERLMAELDSFFAEVSPAPSLLHGDLWSGNYSFDTAGQPVLFDPAIYYGDREADIAMTELFGGFPSAFYAAYQEAYPLDPGYEIRKTLYNLYHILNHLNLFGGGYLRQAEQMTDRLLAQI
jgi:protein-ribulosamine 3-kinase